MKTFKIIDGDIAFDSNGTIVMTDGADEEAQALERCFTTNVSEWFLNATHGLEYNRVRGKNISDGSIRAAVIKAAVQDARVKEVIGIDIEREKAKRNIIIRFHCILSSGTQRTINFNI